MPANDTQSRYDKYRHHIWSSVAFGIAAIPALFERAFTSAIVCGMCIVLIAIDALLESRHD